VRWDTLTNVRPRGVRLGQPNNRGACAGTLPSTPCHEAEGDQRDEQPWSRDDRNRGRPPHNRWSFQHVQELFPTCRLARDPSAALVLPAQRQDILQLNFEAVDGASTSLGELLGKACCDAFLVLHDGHLVAEHYFNGMTVSSHHLLNSITKSFVGMLAGIAVDRDQLAQSSLVTRYLPELDNAAWRGTTRQSWSTHRVSRMWVLA
jgi:CubicO group peptidase (beta-lactamase class C family)